MPRGSIGRTVARAAATGGNRSYRGRAPVGFYALLVVLCAAGLSLIGYSRYEAQHPAATTTTSSSTTSTIGPNQSSHWYAALTVDICGKISTLPVSTDTKDSGIISLGGGIVYIAPGNVANFQDFSGKLATLGQFVIYAKPKVTLTATELQIPGKGEKLWKNGDLCGSKPGRVEVEAWQTVAAPSGTLVAKPADLKFANGQMITIAFLPAGEAVPPASKALQEELELDVEESEVSTTTTLPVATTTTVTGATTTTVKGATTTTVKGATTTTAAGGSTTSTTATTTTVAGSTTTSTKP